MREAVKTLRREQLIEATIDTIARRGFQRTTLAQVAAQARMSPGIVNFYFKTKEALLHETLAALAAEYEAAWKRAVAPLAADPVAALDAIIDVDLGPEICNRRKVAVWAAFWAESHSRPKYRKLNAALAADYLRQTSGLCARIAERGGYRALDIAAIARGLNAMINGLWLDFLFDPNGFDRVLAKTACRAHLAAAFPDEFGAPLGGRRLATRRVSA